MLVEQEQGYDSSAGATFHGDPGSQAASLLGLSRGPWRPLPDHPALAFRQGGREWGDPARFLVSSPRGHILLVGSNPQAPRSGSSPQEQRRPWRVPALGGQQRPRRPACCEPS